MNARNMLSPKLKKAAFNKENDLFDIWLPDQDEYGHWEEHFLLS